MSAPTSLVPVSKVEALRAAEAIIAAVDAARLEAKEALIVEAMTAHRWVFCLRPPFVRHLNREEAETLVNTAPADIMSSDWQWFNWRVKSACQRAEAERLVSACHLTQDGYVWLNLEQAHEVREWQ